MSLTQQQESINTQAPWLSLGNRKAVELKQKEAESKPSRDPPPRDSHIKPGLCH